VSHRPAGFVAARASFMCDHCRSLVPIAASETAAKEAEAVPPPRPRAWIPRKRSICRDLW